MENEYSVTKFIWILLNTSSKIDFKNIYIPYSCEFLLPEQSNDDYRSYFNIFEFHHPHELSKNLVTSRFGTWDERKGLEKLKLNFYQTRFDMNKTLLTIISRFSVILT